MNGVEVCSSTPFLLHFNLKYYHKMSQKALFILQIIFILLMSCSNPKDAFFQSPVINDKNIQLETLVLDSMLFDKIESTYLGFAEIVDNEIYFIDQRLCHVFIFDNEGNFLRRTMGKGRGPTEISTNVIDGYERLPKKGHFFLGGMLDCHIFNDNFERKSTYIMKKRPGANQPLDVTPDNPLIYTLVYNKLILKEHNGYMYLPIYIEQPTLNFVINSKSYYANSRVIAKMNLINGEIEILGRTSPVYDSNPELRQFPWVIFDISNNGEFYLSFEADSLIYVYDDNFNIKSAFGFRGRNMNDDYMDISVSVERFGENFMTQRKTCGYYDWIRYIDERDLLFRSYHRGAESQTDGLQIYKSKTLIADVDVPKGFRVMGYIEPYFYSSPIIDEYQQSIIALRFRIDL